MNWYKNPKPTKSEQRKTMRELFGIRDPIDVALSNMKNMMTGRRARPSAAPPTPIPPVQKPNP